MPEKKPIVGLTPDFGQSLERPGRPSLPRYELKQNYVEAVLRAGGLPLILPPVEEDADLDAIIDAVDALVVTGGAFDVPPSEYGEAERANLGPLKPARTIYERRLLRKALAQGRPVLGVCGGMQVLAVELGGTLVQDLPTEWEGALSHEQKHDPHETAHEVRVAPGSLLHRATGQARFDVNTTHHQAVRDPGRARVTGKAPDGVIEAIEGDGRFVLGVQWHPELLDREEARAVYRGLVDAARDPSSNP